MKISVANFKTIDANASQKDYRKMCCLVLKENGIGNLQIGWLNDQVCAYIETTTTVLYFALNI